MSEIRPGYKQTEVGVIPEDWEVTTMGQHAKFRTGPFGSTLHKSDYTEDGVPIINPMHIFDGKIIPTRTATVTQDTAKRLSTFCLQSGDIIIARRGEMGRCAIILEEHEGWICGTGSLIIRGANDLCPSFLQRVLSSPNAIYAIEEASVGTTMVNLNQSVLSNLSIQLPTLAEQTAIAAVLSDTDTLIQKLDQLIAKKRNIKQGTMQELLTGKRRLPGFSGAKTEGGLVRESLGLGELFVSKPKIRTVSINELITFLGMEDISANGGLISQRKIKMSEIRIGLTAFEKNDVLVAKITPCFENGKGACLDNLLTEVGYGSTEFHVLRAKPIANARYIYYHTQSEFFRKKIELEMVGTAGQKRVPINAIEKYQLPARHALAEQTAIATVLSDMDAEIADLEQKRDKYKAVKQGMMQVLLTGKVRLV